MRSAVDISDFKADDQIPDDRIVQECGRLEVGYITFSNAADYNTYDIVNTALWKASLKHWPVRSSHIGAIWPWILVTSRRTTKFRTIGLCKNADVLKLVTSRLAMPQTTIHMTS